MSATDSPPDLANILRLAENMQRDTFAEPATSHAALAEMGPTMLPLLARRLALCIADEPTGVYQEGRRAAFAEAVAWLRERAKAADAEVDDECDGVDADRFCELAETLRGEAKGLEAWAKAGCPKVGA